MRGIVIALSIGLAGGIAVGLFLDRAYPGAGETSVVRDIVDVPVMTTDDAEAQRQTGFGDVSSIQDTLRFPTEFLRAESLYVLAGRADSAGLQQLVFEADRIADDGARTRSLTILFQRLAELDPQSGVAIARIPSFAASPHIERTVWSTWAQLDLDAALAAAASEPSWERRDSIAQALYAALGFAENEDTVRVEHALGIPPSPIARSRYVRMLAERSPGEAIDLVNALDEASVDRALLVAMGHAIGIQFGQRANVYEGRLSNPEHREVFREGMVRAQAELDPDAAIQRMLGVSRTQKDDENLTIALNAVALRDVDRIIAFFEETTSEKDRMAIGSAIVRALARTDPRRAIDWAVENDRGVERRFLYQALEAVARKDPQLALEFAETVGQQDRRINFVHIVLRTVAKSDRAFALSYIESIEDSQIRSGAATALIQQWAQEDPDGAVDWALANGYFDDRRILQSLGGQIARSDVDAAIRLLPHIEGQELLRWRYEITNALLMQRSMAEAQLFVAQFEGTSDYEQLQTAIIGRVGNQDVDTAVRMIGELSTVRARDRAYQQLAMTQAMNDPADAARWIDEIEGSEPRRQSIEFLLRSWSNQDEAAARRWIERMPEGRDRDDSIITVAASWSEATPVRNRLIESVTDPAKRAKARQVQIAAIARTDWRNAEVMLAASSLSSAEKAAVRQAIDRYKSVAP